MQWTYLAAILAFAGAATTAALMVVPLHRLASGDLGDVWRRSRNALLAAMAMVATAVYLPLWVNPLLQRSALMERFTDLVEGTTLGLSLFFYTLPGFARPAITHAPDGDPVIFHGDFAIQMAPNCAGYQGMMIPVAALALFIAIDWRRLHLPRALLLAIATVGAVFVMNSVRIALLPGIGVHISERVAVNGFHSCFGTISLLAVVGLVRLILQNRVFDRSPARRLGGASGFAPATSPTGSRPFEDHVDLAPLLLPLAVMLAVSFAVGAAQDEFNWLYAVPALTGACPSGGCAGGSSPRWPAARPWPPWPAGSPSMPSGSR